GITGTPVIDTSTSTLYVVAKTKEVRSGVTSYVHRLHALDVRTGEEKFDGPVVIQATVPGTGDGSVGGQLPFHQRRDPQRGGLPLLSGVVHIPWAPPGDCGPNRGWPTGSPPQPRGLGALHTPPPGGGWGGIGRGGGPPAADADSNIY